MTADTSEFESETSGVRGTQGKCKVALTVDLIREDDPDFAESVAAALQAKTKITNGAIEIVLKRHGYSVSDATIRKHRIGICQCQTK